MTCDMWLAARPPCSSGQPRVSHLRSASFAWNERRKSPRSSPASPHPPAPPPPPSAAPPAHTPTPDPPPPPPSPTPTFLQPDQLPPLTLAGVFPPRDLSALRLDPARLRTLIATGDVIPARHTDVVIRSRGDDFLYPIAATKEITAAADLTVKIGRASCG